MDNDGGRSFTALLAIPASQRTYADLDALVLGMLQIICFRTYSNKELAEFASVATLRTATTNDILFRQGETGNEWFAIYRGSVDVAVSKTGNLLDSEVVCTLFEGYAFGEAAILGNSPRNATITVREPSQFIVVRGDVFSRVHSRRAPGQSQSVDEDLADEVSISTTSEETNSVAASDDDFISRPSLDDDSPFSNVNNLELLNDSIRDALETPPGERTEEDLMDILEEMNHLKAFAHLSTSARAHLCRVVTLEHLGESGTTLFKQGDVGTSWYVIYRGSVNVVVNNVVVCALQEGEGFGELALVNDKPRPQNAVCVRGPDASSSATIVSREDDCQIIKVDKEDYNRIMRNIEHNTVRLEEHGKTVMVLEKKGTAQKSQGFVVMSATVDKLVAHLEEDHAADANYVTDFLLMFRTFITPPELLAKLVARFNAVSSEPTLTAPQTRIRNKLVAILRLWILHHYIDFELDANLLKPIYEIIDTLAKANVHFEHDLLVSALEARGLDLNGHKRTMPEEKFNDVAPGNMDTITMKRFSIDKNGTLSRRRQSMKKMLAKTFARLHVKVAVDHEDFGDEMLQEVPVAPGSIPTFSHPPDVVRIYRPDGAFKSMRVEVHNTAAEVLTQAVQKFQVVAGALPGAEKDYRLVEVCSDGATRQYSPEETGIVSKMSLCGRLYLSNPTLNEKLAAPECTFSRDQNGHSLILEVSTEEVARLMTALDHELMSRINPLEYIYHIFKVKGANAVNLSTFTSRFNQINYWVVTEVVYTRTLSKRVQTLKKFIKLASICRTLNNFNSCFAILSGLNNTAVSRLQQTWKKLSAKHQQEFEALNALMDPSRNMKTYRQLLLNSPPPLIPFYPLLLKDLFFMHDCNVTTVNELINFDKLRLLAGIIRFMDAFRYVRYDQLNDASMVAMLKKRRSTVEVITDSVLEKAHSTQKIMDYLGAPQVVDDMRVLSAQSRDIEKPSNRTVRASSFIFK